MRTFTIISTLLLVFFSALLILGVLSASDSNVRVSGIVEAPLAVVLKALLDIENHEQWWKAIAEQEYTPETNARRVIYIIGSRKIILQEKIQYLPAENTLLFKQNDPIPRAHIQNWLMEINLRDLADGNTEIIWQIRYQVKPIFVKVLNGVFLKPMLNSMIRKNIQSLKTFIER